MKLAPIDPPPIFDAQWHDISGAVAWDIGANGGQSLRHLVTCFQNVVAFEPALECGQYLAAWATNPKVTVASVAVSSMDGAIELAVLPEQIATGQLVTPGTHGMEWSPSLPDGTGRKVPAYCVDTLVDMYPPPDFMKIDVEGHEYHVLDGARATLRNLHPMILLEFHAPELYESCVDLLTGFDYTIEVIRHPWYEKDSRMWHQHGWVRASF